MTSAGPFLSWHGRRLLRASLIALPVALTIRTFFLQPFVVAGNGAAPEIPAGSHVLVWKLSTSFVPGDLLTYRHGNEAYVGRVVLNRPTAVTVNRNGQPDDVIPRDRVIGKVVSVYWRGSMPAPASADSPSGDKNGAIGLALEKKDGRILITEFVPNTPAADGRLHVGDEVLAFGPGADRMTPTKGLSLGDCAKSMRGPVGSPIFLRIIPVGKTEAEAEVLEYRRQLIPVLEAERLGQLGNEHQDAGESTGSTSADVWSPTLAPGEKPDLQKIMLDTRELISRGRYEEALLRQLWFHYHALEVDPAYSGVRLSFALSDWTELARRYPKARQAMIEVRDRDTRAFAAGRGYFDLFMEVAALNKSLRDEAATQTLFKSIEQSEPALAKQCAIVLASAGKDNAPPANGVSPARSAEILLKRFTFDDRPLDSDALVGTDAKGIRSWAVSGTDMLGELKSHLDELLKTHGEQDPEVVAQRARIDARARLVSKPRVVRLFEVANPSVEDCTVLYRAKLSTDHLEGRAYLEMWCRFPGSGEFFSRGLDQPLSGSNDWISCQIPFFLKKGEKPDLIRLNVVIEGDGFVKVRDIELSATSFPTAP